MNAGASRLHGQRESAAPVEIPTGKRLFLKIFCRGSNATVSAGKRRFGQITFLLKLGIGSEEEIVKDPIQFPLGDRQYLLPHFSMSGTATNVDFQWDL